MKTGLSSEEVLEILKEDPELNLEQKTILIRNLWDSVEHDVRAIMEYLWEIKHTRQFSEKYLTFEEYCQKELPFGKRRAYQLTEAQDVIHSLPETCEYVNGRSLNEWQLRELAKIPAENRLEVLEKAEAQATADGKPLTTRYIGDAVRAFLPVAKSKTRKARPGHATCDLIALWLASSMAERSRFAAWIDANGEMDTLSGAVRHSSA